MRCRRLAVRESSVETALALRSTCSCAWIAVVKAHHAATRSSSHSSMKAENWFQLRVVGVTTEARDSDFGQSPLMRCGKYVSAACTLDLAPVQVRDTFGVLLNRASLELPFGKHQGRLASELRADQNCVAWFETLPLLCASSASGSGPLSRLCKTRDVHEALELASMVLSADDGAAQRVAEGMGIISARASQKTSPTPG